MRNEKRADGSGGGVRRHPGSFSRAGSLFRGFLGEWRTHTEL